MNQLIIYKKFRIILSLVVFNSYLKLINYLKNKKSETIKFNINYQLKYK